MNGLLEQLVEGSPFGILVVDTTGVLRVLNPCARRIVTTIGNPIGVQFVEAIPVLYIRWFPVKDVSRFFNLR